jgi:N-acetylneuraminic acid mutarotase
MDASLVALAIVLTIGLAACSDHATSQVPSPSPGQDVPAASAPAGSPTSSGSPDLPRIDGTWATGRPTPSRRGENAAVALDGLVYLAGGLDIHGRSLDTFESFDPRSGTWTTLPPLPAPRDHMGLAALDGRIYLTGGGEFMTPAVRSGTWSYDPPTRHWAALTPMPASRWQHASVALGGKIYVVGGIVQGPDARALWAYDPTMGTWQTDLAPLPTEREHLTAVAADGLLIAIGGRKTHQIGAIEAYDPKVNGWRSLPDLPTPRGGSAAGLIGDVIHVAGGENLNDNSTYSQHEALDLATMTWSKAPDLPTKRHGLASAVVDGRWYVIGGGRAAGLSVSDIVEISAP